MRTTLSLVQGELRPRILAHASHRETPVRETVAQEESTPGPSSRGMSSDDHLEPATSSERPVMLPLAGKALRAEPDSHPSSLAALAPHDSETALHLWR